MRIIKKDDITQPFLSPEGEMIYEMIGRPQELGGTTRHSLAHVVIPSGKYSPPHYHKVSEETYYMLSGKARMIINGHEFKLLPGQACLIMPGEIHKIVNDENENLEFLAISAPAWVPEDSFPV